MASTYRTPRKDNPRIIRPCTGHLRETLVTITCRHAETLRIPTAKPNTRARLEFKVHFSFSAVSSLCRHRRSLNHDRTIKAVGHVRHFEVAEARDLWLLASQAPLQQDTKNKVAAESFGMCQSITRSTRQTQGLWAAWEGETNFGQIQVWPKYVTKFGQTNFGQDQLWPDQLWPRPTLARPTLAKTNFGQVWPKSFWKVTTFHIETLC